MRQGTWDALTAERDALKAAWDAGRQRLLERETEIERLKKANELLGTPMAEKIIAKVEKSIETLENVRDQREGYVNDLRAEVARLSANQQHTCEAHKDEVKKGGSCCWCQLVRLQKIVDDWAGLVAAHQPVPPVVEPVVTYSHPGLNGG
jgi:uncharacterized protein YhaN